jgi:hypothetical protein
LPMLLFADQDLAIVGEQQLLVRVEMVGLVG